MSSEQLAQPISLPELLTRRSVLGAALGVLATAASLDIGKTTYRTAQSALNLYRSIGNDYSNRPFYEQTGAQMIDRERLDTLTEDAAGIPVLLRAYEGETQADQEPLAQYRMELDQDGPVCAEFDGLFGDGESLTVVRAVVDGADEFLIPLLRSEDEQEPTRIQLGSLEQGSHTLELFNEYGDMTASSDEVTPRLTQNTSETVRALLEMHQPDIYLYDYGDLANNFPWRSYVVVSETDESIIAVYTTECLDEDQIFGVFGTSVQKLVQTKDRPTDYDWAMEKQISKYDGSLIRATLATPYHTRKDVTNELTDEVTHTPVRIASLNNNLEIVTDSSVLQRPKIRFLPQIVTYEEMRAILHTTDTAAARHSLCENYEEGRIHPQSNEDAAILHTYGLDVSDCKM